MVLCTLIQNPYGAKQSLNQLRGSDTSANVYGVNVDGDTACACTRRSVLEEFRLTRSSSSGI